MENLASLLEVKGAIPSPTPSSRATGRGQRVVLELLTAAEARCSAEARGLLCISDQTGSICSLRRKSSQDMQTPSELSMLRLRRFVRYLFGAADAGPFFAYEDEPNTVLVWTDGDWSGHAVTYKSTSAGAVQLGSHTIETWSVNQQVVSLSSSESEFYAIGSGCARGLTVKHVLQEIPHTTSPDGDVKMIVCTESDAARGMSHRVGCGRVRHLQTRFLWHQQALPCVRDNSTWFGNGGDGELYEQACNRRCKHLARCDRCGPDTSDQCEQRSDCG